MRNQGVTLFELLITVGLLSILLSYVIPTFNRLSTSAQVSSLTNHLYRTIKMAYSEAITRNQTVRICPSQNGQTCYLQGGWDNGWIIFVDINKDRQVNAEEPIIRANITETGSIIRLNGPENMVTVRADGRISRNRSLFICSTHHDVKTKRLVMIHSGRLRITNATVTQQKKFCR